MKWRKSLCRLLTLFIVVETVVWQIEKIDVFASDKEMMPPLIQSTTLEGDYQAAASLGLAVTRSSKEEDTQKAFEKVLCSCVRIQVNGHYGSGSIYKMLENEVIIVTNRHVLQYWNDDSYVTFFNGRVSDGNLLGTSKEADLGFISIPTDNFTYDELLAFRNIRMIRETESGDYEKETFGEGRRIFMVDMASKWNVPVMKEGEVISLSVYLEDFQTQMLYAKGNAVPGMSGSGVFDGYGNYLGMLTGGTDQGEIAAVPAGTIYGEYMRIYKNQLI